MDSFIPPNNFDEEQLAERLELFRYTDLTQPLIQQLFSLLPPKAEIPEAE